MNNVRALVFITKQEAINAIMKFNGDIKSAAAYLKVPERTLKNKLIKANMWRYK